MFAVHPLRALAAVLCVQFGMTFLEKPDAPGVLVFVGWVLALSWPWVMFGRGTRVDGVLRGRGL